MAGIDDLLVSQVVGEDLVDPKSAPANAESLTDPRVSHALTLGVDDFGNVRQVLLIA